jgi:hypothetical protein
MPRLRCHYVDCIYLEGGLCGASAVELDPDEGCMTYTHITDVSTEEDDWDEDSLEEVWEEASEEANEEGWEED